MTSTLHPNWQATVVSPTFTHLVLGRCLPNPEYRLVPQALIVRVDAAAVQLRLSRPDVDQLPRRTAL